MASAIPHEPMLFIIGATGTGKSKLAVELATRFNGEIINGDAMQMYKGLPIITNKIPNNERNGIPHHLIDFIGLDEQPWTVGHFVSEAQKVIRDIRSRGRLPILVGGTHYYTQSLLFQNSLINDGHESSLKDEHAERQWPILSASTEQMYAKLEELDPVIASRWHPRDRRHIKRSLEICLQTGRKASEVYQERDEQKRISSKECGDPEDGVGTKVDQSERLRYPSMIFWLHAQEDVLKARLDGRVKTMVMNGLLEEAVDMSKHHTENTSQSVAMDLDKGIWVSIGYKETQPYIAALRGGECSDEELTRIRDQSVEAVMAGTRQYAKRQTRWIRLTFANFLTKASALDRLFLMDCTELERWTEMVSEPSGRIVEAFLNGSQLPDPSSLSSLAKSVLSNSSNGSAKPQFLTRKCSVCDKIMMSDKEWTKHLNSSAHKKVIEGQRRRAENERRRQEAAAARLVAVTTSEWPCSDER